MFLSRANILQHGRRDPVQNYEIDEIHHLKSGIPWKSAVTQKKQDAKILGKDGKVKRGDGRDWRSENLKIKSPPKTDDSPEYCLVKLSDIHSGVYGRQCQSCGESSMKVSVKTEIGYHNKWLRAECENCKVRYDNDTPMIGQIMCLT